MKCPKCGHELDNAEEGVCQEPPYMSSNFVKAQPQILARLNKIYERLDMLEDAATQVKALAKRVKDLEDARYLKWGR